MRAPRLNDLLEITASQQIYHRPIGTFVSPTPIFLIDAKASC